MNDESSTLTTNSDLPITKHEPIMVAEVIQTLSIIPEKWYIDATAGGGGHSLAILHAGGRVLALDRDTQALERVQKRLHATGVREHRYQLAQADFTQIDQILHLLPEKPHGILFDLGLSSDQLDNPARGFSFRHQAYLDMRMDQEQPVTAADILKTYSEEKIADLLYHLADESQSRKIAKAIVQFRQEQPIETTQQLADIVTSVKSQPPGSHIHPATQTFQALRMVVNQELEQIAQGLANAWQILPPGGRIAVISFHSGEDRIVKKFFQYQVQFNHAKLYQPKLQTAQPHEIEHNPRARSAKLRGIIKNLVTKK